MGSSNSSSCFSLLALSPSRRRSLAFIFWLSDFCAWRDWREQQQRLMTHPERHKGIVKHAKNEYVNTEAPILNLTKTVTKSRPLQVTDGFFFFYTLSLTWSTISHFYWWQYYLFEANDLIIHVLFLSVVTAAEGEAWNTYRQSGGCNRRQIGT